MNKIFLITAAVFTLLSCSKVQLMSPQQGNDDEILNINQGKKIVEINGKDIHEGYLETIGKINPRVAAQLSNPLARKGLIDNLIEQELLYQEAVKRGLHTSPEVAQKTALTRKIIIAQSLLEDEMTKRARKEFEDKKETEFTKVKIAHVQIGFRSTPEEGEGKEPKDAPPSTEEKQASLAKAKAVRERLVGGEDFAKVAEEVSDDKGSKKKGGDLGAVSQNDRRMARRGLAKLAELAFVLKKNEISEPVESEKGYHIVKVTSDPEVAKFEEAERVLRFQLQKEVRDSLVGELKKNAKIDVAGKEPDKTPPAAGPGPAEAPPPGAPDGAIPPHGEGHGHEAPPPPIGAEPPPPPAEASPPDAQPGIPSDAPGAPPTQ